MEEQQKAIELQKQPNKSPAQIQKLLDVLRDGSLGMADAVYEYTWLLLSKFRTKNDQLRNLESYARASHELGAPRKSTFKAAYDRLKKFLGDNNFIRRLLIDQEHINEREALDGFVNTRTLYEQMIREDLTDYPTRKHNLALYKLSRNLSDYLHHLNGFVELNPSDQEGWQELAVVYHETGHLEKAGFCYQELIMLNPRNDHYYVRLGELFFSQGGTTNLKYAKDYFCYVVARDDRNYRALWCLNRVCRALLEEDEANDKIKSLYDATTNKLKQSYGRASKSRVTLTNFKF